MFRKSRMLAVAAAGAVALSLTACSTSSPGGTTSTGGAAPTQITIGFVGSLTGSLASSGINALAGLKVGAEYAHTKYPNLTVTVKELDTGGDATKAVSLTKQLASEGVTAIYFTTEAFAPVQGTLNQVKIPGGTAGGIGPILSDTGDNRLYKYAFSTGAGTSGDTSIIPYLDYLKQFGNKIGILDDSTAFNTSQTDLTKKLVAANYPDITLVTQSFASTASDATAQLQALKDAGVNSLILYSYGAPAVTAMNSLAKLGWTPNMAAELGIGADATVAVIKTIPAMATKIAAGPIAKTFMDASLDTSGIVKTFVSGYLKQQNNKATFNALDTVGAISFDWALIVAQATQEAKTTNGDAIKNYLTSGAPLTGSNGTYKFGPDVRIGIDASQLTLFNPASSCDISGICKAVGK